MLTAAPAVLLVVGALPKGQAVGSMKSGGGRRRRFNQLTAEPSSQKRTTEKLGPSTVPAHHRTHEENSSS